MARHKTGFYSTIEYIGPRPAKPKKQSFFGGWVILLLAGGLGFWFGKPLVAPLINAEQASSEQAEVLSDSLEGSGDLGRQLAAAALRRSQEKIAYDPAYYRIAYPMGDIPPGKGAAADVVIRSLRVIGVDLQVEVHEDMKANFRQYPQLWNAMGPDANIDHRRVANLQRFFERHGETLSATRNTADYQPGDIVIWSLANADKHIGIVVPGPGQRSNEAWVVHNIGAGVKWENTLFDYKVEAHFRYPVE